MAGGPTTAAECSLADNAPEEWWQSHDHLFKNSC